MLSFSDPVRILRVEDAAGCVRRAGCVAHQCGRSSHACCRRPSDRQLAQTTRSLCALQRRQPLHASRPLPAGNSRLAADLELFELGDRRLRNQPITFNRRVGLLYIRSRSISDSPPTNLYERLNSGVRGQARAFCVARTCVQADAITHMAPCCSSGSTDCRQAVLNSDDVLRARWFRAARWDMLPGAVLRLMDLRFFSARPLCNRYCGTGRSPASAPKHSITIPE